MVIATAVRGNISSGSVVNSVIEYNISVQITIKSKLGRDIRFK